MRNQILESDFNTNEALIQRCMDNVNEAGDKKVNRLYWTIINNSILKPITQYSELKTLTDDDAIGHHGSRNVWVERKLPHKDANIAKALSLLRKHLPYTLAKWLTASKSNMRSDRLYHAINDWKYQCNSDFYRLFNLSKT